MPIGKVARAHSTRRPHGGSPIVPLLFCALTLIGVAFGAIRPPVRHLISGATVAPLATQTSESSTALAPAVVATRVVSSRVPAGWPIFGTWAPSASGAASSPWYASGSNIEALVASSIGATSTKLWLEADDAGNVVHRPLQLPSVNNEWLSQRLHLPDGSRSFRIVATSSASLTAEWVAFSNPYRSRTNLRSGLVAVVRYGLTMVMCLTLLLGPGVALHTLCHRDSGREPSLVFLALPGFALLVLMACVIWVVARSVSPHTVATVMSVGVVAFLSVVALRFRPTLRYTRSTAMILRIFLVAFAVVGARSLWSPGPAGELYGGGISRVLESGDRPDSRISYHVVQLVAHGTNPYSAVGRANFLPYSFSDRGPLSGLAASPLVLLTGAKVPTGTPDQPWEPFDPEGFGAYRVAMGAFSLMSLLCLAGLVFSLVGPEGAVFAALLAATTPFVIHESYFTWPKLITTAFLLMAAQLIIQRRYLLSGLCAGTAYLCHPLALLFLPGLGLLALLSVHGERPQGWNLRDSARAAAGMLVGVGVGVVGWRLANGRNYKQSGFLLYFRLVDSARVHSLGGWISGRAESTLNTLVPGYLLVAHSGDHSINALEKKSSFVIHFFFQYWTTLPFGFGLLGLPLLILVLIQAAKRSPWVTIATIIIPFMVFAVYWGAAITGMMREGLHPWLFTLFVVWAWTWYRRPIAGAARARWARRLLGIRGLEVPAMMLIPSVWNQHGLWQREFELTDIVGLSVIIVGTLWLSWAMARSATPSGLGQPDSVLQLDLK